MLSLAQANHYATQFLTSSAHAQQMQPFPASANITVDDAYLIARQIQSKRLAAGEVQIGRKIGYANQRLLKIYGKNKPVQGIIWAPLFSSTVRYLKESHGIQSLTGAMQPRLAPEIIFKFGATPSLNASLKEIADCIEWMAHGMEIVVCPFPNWEFNRTDAIAALAFHGTLLIGEPQQLTPTSRHHLSQLLSNTTVSLSCDNTLLSAGFGYDLLKSPLHAIWHLQQLLKHQPDTTTLQAGEIICTGTWTDLPNITAGQTWRSAFSGADLPGLSISFI